MSVTYISPSNPGAASQAERDAAATANWNAIKAAAAAVNNTASPTRLGENGAKQGIVRCRPGIWWLACTNNLTAALGFNNRYIQFAPGATVISADTAAGFIFTMTGSLTNCDVNGEPWATDGAEPAAPATMANKVGAGWPAVAPNLGGGDPDGPKITANGDPDVPWTQPVAQMMSVGVDRLKWTWINNHCGFINAQDCSFCGHDRQFYFGYREASSSGAAMMVPRATAAAGGGVNGNGNASPHNFRHTNQFMINAPQGFGLNQWTDCRTGYVENLYCCGGEAMRMETHKPNDGGIHNITGSLIAQRGGNVGQAWVPHQAQNGIVQLAYLWCHSAEYGAFKIKQGSTPATGSFAAGSFIRHITCIGGDKTWAQKQTVTSGSEGNTPTLPQRACFIDSGLSWRNNVAIGGTIAFGHNDAFTSADPTTAGHLGVAVKADGFAMGSGFGGANASDGVAANTRDLTGPHPDGPPPVDDLLADAASSSHPTTAIAASLTSTPTLSAAPAAATTPTASVSTNVITVGTHLVPDLLIAPEDGSTSSAPFFMASVEEPSSWRWRLDDGPVVLGQYAAAVDQLVFPNVKPGVHTVSVWVVSDGLTMPPTIHEWNIPEILSRPPAAPTLVEEPYSVWVMSRDGRDRVGVLPVTMVSWKRARKATTEAQVQLPQVFDPECCELLAKLHSWEYSLGIWRGNTCVWEGPLLNGSYSSGQLTAKDVSQWWVDRAIHDTHHDVLVAPEDIMRGYAIDAGRPDPPGLSITILGRSAKITRDVPGGQKNAYSEITQVASDNGVQWSVLRRNVRIGRPTTEEPIVVLTDASFVDIPDVGFDGLGIATKVYAVGAGTDDVAEVAIGQAAHPDPSVGLHESVLTGSDADSFSLQNQANAGVSYERITVGDGQLAPSVPVSIQQLLPDALVDLRLVKGCRPVTGLYRIDTVDVAKQQGSAETIKLGLVPA